MTRGILTDDIKRLSKQLLGREIDVLELRLMPYIQYTMVNNQKINPQKINGEERKILQIWRDESHIIGGITGLSITKEFWDIINEIIFKSYVER